MALGSDGWHFLDPRLEGRFRAFRKTLAPIDILEAAAVMEDGLLDAQDSRVEWEPGELVLGVSERLIGYLNSDEYRKAMRDSYETLIERGLRVP